MRVVVSVIVGAVGLGVACSPGKPTVLPTPSATVSPTPTPSSRPSPLTSAEIARQAVEAVREYYAEVDRAYATGDTTRLRTLSTPTCSCLRLVTYIEDRWSRGSLQGLGTDIVSTSPHDLSQTVVSVRVTYDGRAGAELDKMGNVTKRIPAAPGQMVDITVQGQGTEWLVQDVAVLKQ